MENAEQSIGQESMNWRRVALEFFLFAVGGALFGAAVGFFFFMQLGFPRPPELAGFVSGLFVVAGFKVGLLTWIIYKIVLRRRSSTIR
jgi:hypothetical protein